MEQFRNKIALGFGIKNDIVHVHRLQYNIMQNNLKELAQKLRQEGKTYSEIIAELKVTIVKSTLSYWCKDVIMSQKATMRLNALVNSSLSRARIKAAMIKKEKQRAYINSITFNNLYLQNYLENDDFARSILAILYLAEGSKNRSGSLTFGNSDPRIIQLFIKLLKQCYPIDNLKFRCTVQCRDDQDVLELMEFWSKTTKIPQAQFYKTVIDQRTIGKITKKLNYKGVCRVDYFSAHIYHELTCIANIILS